jgi:hypothetical protein
MARMWSGLKNTSPTVKDSSDRVNRLLGRASKAAEGINPHKYLTELFARIVNRCRQAMRTETHEGIKTAPRSLLNYLKSLPKITSASAGRDDKNLSMSSRPFLLPSRLFFLHPVLG